MMDRVTAKLRRALEPKGDGGFKFAISLIAVLISAIFYIYNYCKNNFISFRASEYLLLLLFLLTVPLLDITCYIFFKAVSLETKSPKDKESLQNIATNYYLYAFKYTIILVLAIMGMAILKIPTFGIGVSLSLIIFFKLLISVPEFSEIMKIKLLKLKEIILSKFKEKQESEYILNEVIFKIVSMLSELKEKQKSKYKLIEKVLLVLVIIIAIIAGTLAIKCITLLPKEVSVLIFLFSIYFVMAQFNAFKPLNLLKGNFEITFLFFIFAFVIAVFILLSIIPVHVVTEMNSIYYKQDKQIPVDISVTGGGSALVSVDLYSADYELPYDSMEMQSYSNISEELFLGKSKNANLCGNYLGAGRYKIYINCSNLTEGYYVLSVANGNLSSKRLETQSIEEDVDEYLYGKRVINSFYLIDGNRT